MYKNKCENRLQKYKKVWKRVKIISSFRFKPLFIWPACLLSLSLFLVLKLGKKAAPTFILKQNAKERNNFGYSDLSKSFVELPQEENRRSTGVVWTLFRLLNLDEK